MKSKTDRKEEPMVIRITGISPRPDEERENAAVSSPFRVFEDFFNNWAVSNALARRRANWRPPVDILEKDNKFLIRAEIPGIEEKDLVLMLDGSTLTIKGERKSDSEDSGYFCHQVEGFYGSFSRSFDLPNYADTEKISAAFNNGVLTVTIPYKPEVQPRSIQITRG